MANKKKRPYFGECSKCKEYKQITFRSVKNGFKVVVEKNGKTGEEVEVVKSTYRRFRICFDCVNK